MSRQRLPAEKECWCPAELILAWRKEKRRNASDRGRRWKDGKRRSYTGWTEMEKKILFTLTGFSFTCSAFCVWLQGLLFCWWSLRSVVEAFGVNEIDGLFGRWSSAPLSVHRSLVFWVLRGLNTTSVTLKGYLYWNKNPSRAGFVYDWTDDHGLDEVFLMSSYRKAKIPAYLSELFSSRSHYWRSLWICVWTAETVGTGMFSIQEETEGVWAFGYKADLQSLCDGW